VSGRKKKEHHEEHENHERWLVSYADFITLLFAFFVVMYSVSKVDTKKMQQVTESVRWAMHYSGTGGVGQMPIFDGPPSEGGGIASMPGSPHQTLEQKKAIEAFRRRLENKVRPFVMERSGPPAVSITVEDRLLKVKLAANEFFQPGDAALRPQALPVLDAIAEEILPIGRPLVVEGHTDDQPVSGARFRDNWELSTVRAATVVSYLERAHKADPRLFTASGFADTRPAASPDEPGAREINRRIEMALELEPPEPSARPKRQEPMRLPSVH